jgi:hypothetical protein
LSLAVLVAPGALLAQTPDHTGDNTAQFPSKSDLKSLTTSGSYLAARHASVERDAASAAAFYRSALRTDPKNNELLDRAFISSLAEGDIDEAVKLADRILTLDGSWSASATSSRRNTRPRSSTSTSRSADRSPIWSPPCCRAGPVMAPATPRRPWPISTS